MTREGGHFTYSSTKVAFPFFGFPLERGFKMQRVTTDQYHISTWHSGFDHTKNNNKRKD
jgi:hypothetical protein